MSTNEVIMSSKIAVVTGSNQGIGFGTVAELCRRNVGVVYLTSIDEQRGKQSIELLEKSGYYPKFHLLDVTDENSVKVFAKYMKDKYGSVDILINNAGVIDADIYKTTYEDAKRVIGVNFYGVILMQKYFFPILSDNARVINISSDWGHIANIKNPYWIERLTKESLNIDDVNAFVDWFLNSVKNGTINVEDFIENFVISYRVSKVAVSALTRVQQKEVERGISINSLHPGFVKTDMCKGSGDLTIYEAGVAPAYLALDIDQSVKGKFFFFDKSEVDWADSNFNVADTFAEYKMLF